jgi:hypothetical protein
VHDLANLALLLRRHLHLALHDYPQHTVIASIAVAVR